MDNSQTEFANWLYKVWEWFQTTIEALSSAHQQMPNYIRIDYHAD
jgi:hypothetical protein